MARFTQDYNSIKISFLVDIDILGYAYDIYAYGNPLCTHLLGTSTLLKLGVLPKCAKYSPSSIMISLYRNASININDVILFNINVLRRTGCT